MKALADSCAVDASLERPDDFEGWRDVARSLLNDGISPAHIRWTDGTPRSADLFGGTPYRPRDKPSCQSQPSVSREYLELARKALLHSDEQRFDLLYRLLWRLQRDGSLMEDKTDPDVRRIVLLAREVRRDIHKMRAFLRFRKVQEGEVERFVAWFEPEHHILRASANFFVNRFASMHWTILTPKGTLDWNGEALREGPPAKREDAPRDDEIEALWSDYYASIFNPSRLKIGAMLKEMPRRYWKNMPETAQIPSMIAGARARELAMVEAGADRFADAEMPRDLVTLAESVRACRRCAIGCNGTRAVCGEGYSGAELMIVGEQPGDVEESEGRPFVGPAGQLLMEHLEKAGIERSRAYVTNAVKHFKFSPRGKRRIHETPTAGEIDRCRWWLDGERAIVGPQLILALGASAARGILGKTVSVNASRGRGFPLNDGTELWITTHPSYLLRISDAQRAEAAAAFDDDLRSVSRRLATLGAA